MALPDAVRFVETAKLTRANKDAILGGNAARLLKIKLPKPTAAAPAKRAKAKAKVKPKAKRKR
jgi:hypothetical protein